METAFKICLNCGTLNIPFLSWPFTPTRSWKRRWWWVLRTGRITTGSLPAAMQKALPASPTILLCHCLSSLMFITCVTLKMKLRDSPSLEVQYGADLSQRPQKGGLGTQSPKVPAAWVIFAAVLWVKDKRQDPITVLIYFLLLAINIYHVAQCTLSARRENQIKQRRFY